MENKCDGYLDQLIINCEIAKTQQHTKYHVFVVDNCKDFDISVFNLIENRKFAIYVITELNGNNQFTHDRLNDHKSTKSNGYKYPKINDVKSDVLYVGSSTTGVHNRLKQHLGYGHKGISLST
jgi:hypothetical protein